MALGASPSATPVQTVSSSGGHWSASGLGTNTAYTLYAVHTTPSGSSTFSPAYVYSTISGTPAPPTATPPGSVATDEYAGRPSGGISFPPNGSVHYSIPIVVPPGTAGLEPQLSLEFDSQGPFGVAGAGWSIGGLHAVTRCPADLEHEGFIDPVDFDAHDQFCLNGQRLVRTGGASATRLYRTDPETFFYRANGSEKASLATMREIGAALPK
jgi:hypothetical protein